MHGSSSDIVKYTLAWPIKCGGDNNHISFSMNKEDACMESTVKHQVSLTVLHNHMDLVFYVYEQIFLCELDGINDTETDKSSPGTLKLVFDVFSDDYIYRAATLTTFIFPWRGKLFPLNKQIKSNIHHYVFSFQFGKFIQVEIQEHYWYYKVFFFFFFFKNSWKVNVW